MPDRADPILTVENLTKTFSARRLLPWRPATRVQAVRGVGFDVVPGEVVGVVGESGSGKSTVGRMILRLLDADGGAICFEGQDIARLRGDALRAFRRRMQIVFQDPYSSLNPRQTIGGALGEPLIIHGLHKGRRAERVAELLDLVGLPPDSAGRYPHEFSGGQRQRIGIARALAVEPAFLVADEPVSALDVSIQAQIVALLADLQRRFGLSMLIIAHDLALVQRIAQRIVVMYLGQVMEVLPADRLTLPHHPYTRALLSAAPTTDPRARGPRMVLRGDVPSPSRPPSGCAFRTRCPFARSACAAGAGALRDLGDGRRSACIRDDIDRTSWKEDGGGD